MNNIKKRNRSDNWRLIEKKYLLELCKTKIATIEDKNVGSYINKKKHLCWHLIYQSFSNKFGHTRNATQIKQEWRRMKLGAMKRVNADKNCKKKPGCDTSTDEATFIDWEVHNLLKDQFINDSNNCEEDRSEDIDNEIQICKPTNNDMIPGTTINLTTNLLKDQCINNSNNYEDDRSDDIDNEIQIFKPTNNDMIPETTTNSTSDEHHENNDPSNSFDVKSRIQFENFDNITDNVQASTSGKNSNNKCKELSEYETKLLEWNTTKIKENMKCSLQLHELKMKNEKDKHQEELKLLQAQRKYWLLKIEKELKP